jgi:hypothetical protein
MVKLHNEDNESRLLIVGGIHGNEPGSYFAPNFFIKHYTITKGSVWVIPALNVKSIQRNARGIHGDMNRKFNYISKKDKDLDIVSKLKEIILDNKIDLVLNLHDGHGFYRDKYHNHLFNPKAWGQASIIDQNKIDSNSKFANLGDIAKQVQEEVNKDESNNKYNFGVKNTKTKNKNKSMQKSLTYFAVKNKKPAFAIETSKNIKKLEIKVQYQIKAIEAYLKIAKITYKRNIDINDLDAIRKSIYEFKYLRINNFILPLENIRYYLPFIPMAKKNNEYEFDNPLGSITKKKGLYYVFIGNKHINTFKPDYFKIKKGKIQISIKIDGKLKIVDIISQIQVKKNFKVISSKYRINVIGYGNRRDNNKLISLKDISSKYSLDKKKKIYRIEIYDKKIFIGSILVKFK